MESNQIMNLDSQAGTAEFANTHDETVAGFQDDQLSSHSTPGRNTSFPAALGYGSQSELDHGGSDEENDQRDDEKIPEDDVNWTEDEIPEYFTVELINSMSEVSQDVIKSWAGKESIQNIALAYIPQDPLLLPMGAASRAEFLNLTKETGTIQSAVRTLCQEIADLDDYTQPCSAKFTENLNDHIGAISILGDEVKKVQDQLGRELDKFQTSCSLAERNQKLLETLHESVTISVGSMRTELNSLTDKVNGTLSDVSALREQIAEVMGAIDEFKKVIGNAVLALNTQLETQKDQLSSLDKRIKSVEFPKEVQTIKSQRGGDNVIMPRDVDKVKAPPPLSREETRASSQKIQYPSSDIRTKGPDSKSATTLQDLMQMRAAAFFRGGKNSFYGLHCSKANWSYSQEPSSWHKLFGSTSENYQWINWHSKVTQGESHCPTSQAVRVSV
jgi:predicted  nucleic acid-binding Zn-ribbon protein